MQSIKNYWAFHLSEALLLQCLDLVRVRLFRFFLFFLKHGKKHWSCWHSPSIEDGQIVVYTNLNWQRVVRSPTLSRDVSFFLCGQSPPLTIMPWCFKRCLAIFWDRCKWCLGFSWAVSVHGSFTCGDGKSNRSSKILNVSFEGHDWTKTSWRG